MLDYVLYYVVKMVTLCYIIKVPLPQLRQVKCETWTYVRGTTPGKCGRNSQQVLQVCTEKGCVQNNAVGVYMGEHREGGVRTSKGE